MYTINLVKELDPKHSVEKRVVQRLTTMHYFINLFQPVQYLSFLDHMEQSYNAEKIELALKGYLQQHRPVRPKQEYQIIIDSQMESPHHGPCGYYPIKLYFTGHNPIELVFNRSATHFLYLLILLFANRSKRLPFSLLHGFDSPTMIADEHPLVRMTNIVYGVNGKYAVQTLLKDHRYIFSNLRNMVINVTNDFMQHLNYFVPQNYLNSEYAIPLPPEAIILNCSSQFTEITDELICWNEKSSKLLDYYSIIYDNKEVVMQILQKSAFGGKVTPILKTECRHSTWNDDVIRYLRVAAKCDNRARNLLAQIGDQSNDALSINAFDYCKMSAENYDPQGQLRYASYLIMGRYVKKNFKEAVKWLESAATPDNPEAIWILGKCIFYGVGEFQSAETAFMLYESAAYHGSVEAARDCADCLMHGIGTESNVHKAYEYLKYAARMGDTNVKEFCEAVLGYDWQRPLPKNRFEDIVKMYDLVDWKQLNYHLNYITEKGEPELRRLMDCFRLFGTYNKQEYILDLLDQFHNIPSEISWIEHVNNALLIN